MIGIIESEPGVVIKIESDLGTSHIQDTQEYIENLLQLEELGSIEEIKEALRIADEGSDQGNAAIRFAEEVNELLSEIDKTARPSKKDLEECLKAVGDAFENSGYED